MRFHFVAGMTLVAVACAPPSPQPQPDEMEQVVDATRYESPAIPGTVGQVDYAEGNITPAEREDIYDVERRTPAEVVALYAGLLDQGRFADAYDLWNGESIGLSQEQFVALFDRFDTIDAAVGQMEPVQRAENAVFDQVQLTLTGKMADGTNYSLTGPVTVSRADAVADGADDQRRWRIVQMVLTSKPQIADELVEQ